jgi:type I restriction enzyme S subunit
LVSDDRSYAVNQRVCILRPAKVHPQFLAFVANRHPELLAHDDGFNQTHLPNAAFKIMRLPLPPVGEQALIAEFLTREDAAHTGAALRAEREIDLLHEYRTRLIADVVTGKLDVREAAARLPDEIRRCPRQPPAE